MLFQETLENMLKFRPCDE